MTKSLALTLTLPCLLILTLITPLTVEALTNSNSQNSWIEKAPMNQARSDLGTAVVNGRIYAIGGKVLVYQDAYRVESKDVGTNEEYDPNSDNWTEKARMPFPSSDFATVVYNNKIYCIGGGVTDAFNYSTGKWDAKQTTGFNQVYDPTANKWENKTPAPSPQISAQASLVNDKIYLTDGYPNKTLIQIYDPSIDKWDEPITLPYSDLVTSGVIDDKLYFFGNYVTAIYDPTSGSWSNGASSQTSFYKGFLGVTIGEMAPKQAVIFYNPFYAPNSSLYLTQVYNPANNSWVNGASLPLQRQEFGVAVVNDIIYVIGGYIPSYPQVGTIQQTYGITYTAVNEAYYPIEYGQAPPCPKIISPQNIVYNESGIPLTFTLSKSASWIGYSLDGKENVSITDNTTINGLSNGMHNITVYARDVNGVGNSQTVSFTINETASPTIIVAGSGIAVIIAVLLIVVFRKNPKKGPIELHP
jgi:N-acetylneuraminic acid mutarotase